MRYQQYLWCHAEVVNFDLIERGLQREGDTGIGHVDTKQGHTAWESILYFIIFYTTASFYKNINQTHINLVRLLGY